MKYGIWCESSSKIFKTGWLHGWVFQNITFDSAEEAEAWLRDAFKHDCVTYRVSPLT